jgi:ABC-type branched-subunit amino acid transport system substrate-binding protein
VIGELAGSTGAFAVVGAEVFGGSQLAVNQINKTGGLLGKHVVLDNYNDGGSATQASEQFKRALSSGAVAVMGSPDEGQAVADLASEYKIVDIGEVDEGALTVYPNGPSKPPLPWVYSTTLNGFGLGDLLADYALAHCTSLAVLHDPTTYGGGGNDGILQTYAAAHKSKEIVLDDAVAEDWSTGTPVSLTSEIASINKSGAECVEIWLSPQDQATFVTTMHHLGYNWTILGNDNMTQLDIFQSLAGKYANGAIAPQLSSVVKQTPGIKAFDKLFSGTYHITTSVNAYGAYQGTMMLAKAIQMAGSTKNTAIQAALNKLSNFCGLMGCLSFTPSQHCAIQTGELTLVQWNATAKTWHAVLTGK